MIKSRRMRYVEHVPSSEEKKNAFEVWSQNLKRKGHLEKLGIHVRVVSKWIVEKKEI
jgi:hypothetical protein